MVFRAFSQSGTSSSISIFIIFIIKERPPIISIVKCEKYSYAPLSWQAMRFGDLPDWAIELSSRIRGAVSLYELNCESHGHLTACGHSKQEERPFPADLLWREPLFDQMIVNVYQPGEVCTMPFVNYESKCCIISRSSLWKGYCFSPTSSRCLI